MSDAKDNLLHRYPRQIVFLRGQLQKSKLRLALGAGISIPIGFPGWPDLVKKIADQIGGQDVVSGRVEKSSLTAKVQYLQNIFIQGEKAKRGFFNDRYEDEQSLARWHAVLQTSLYVEAKNPKDHPYLRSLVELLKDSKFVVNYNFDDSVERLVGEIFPDDKRKGEKAI